jgi:hypothetical protein
VPLIVIAECFLRYAVLTTNHLGNAIEDSTSAMAFIVVGIYPTTIFRATAPKPAAVTWSSPPLQQAASGGSRLGI